MRSLALQLEFLSRRPRPVMRLVVMASLVGLACAIGIWLWLREAAIRDVELRVDQASQSLQALQAPRPGAPTPAWQTESDKALRQFDLTLEQRLLEIERCAEPPTQVTRITHDEQAPATVVEMKTTQPDKLTVLLECLNGSTRGRAWIASSIETAGAAEAGLTRLQLRR